MTESEAERRAKEAAATHFADNLLGRAASYDAVIVATRALLALDRVECRHEAYHGRCAHCDRKIVNGRVIDQTEEDALWYGPVNPKPAVSNKRHRWA